MPIPSTRHYSYCMKTTTLRPQKSLRFCVEADAALSTLENALAIVRRAGIELGGLRISPCEEGMDVWMRLSAAEEDLLTLCRQRLNNVVGVLAIREFPRPAEAPVQAAPQCAAA